MQICVYELRIYHVNSKCAAAENKVKDVLSLAVLLSQLTNQDWHRNNIELLVVTPALTSVGLPILAATNALKVCKSFLYMRLVLAASSLQTVHVCVFHAERHCIA